MGYGIALLNDFLKTHLKPLLEPHATIEERTKYDPQFIHLREKIERKLQALGETLGHATMEGFFEIKGVIGKIFLYVVLLLLFLGVAGALGRVAWRWRKSYRKGRRKEKRRERQEELELALTMMLKLAAQTDPSASIDNTMTG